MVRVNHGFHVFKDGNSWCAVGPHFVDLMKSPAGFGDTVEEAVVALKEKSQDMPWWKDKAFPGLDQFTIHPASAQVGGREECERYERCEEGACQCHCLDDANDEPLNDYVKDNGQFGMGA